MSRVAIFDWDVHHGDSTAKLFYNDPSVLYISLHRYDKGEFYPQGKFAGFDQLGEEKGKGFNLNYPWDLPHKYITVGDDEYIYALERVFMPILRAYNPELIFISAGFDSGKGDPLGGLDVTQDGFAYMTQRLLSIAPKRTIMALEGGYNLNTISTSAESCLRIMLGEVMPLKNSENLRTFEEMFQKLNPNELGRSTAKEALKHYGEYWPALFKDQKALDLEKRVEANNPDELAVAGGHPNWFIVKQDKLLKKSKANEIDMYNEIYNPDSKSKEENAKIKELIAGYFGTFTFKDNNYVILENLAFEASKGSVLDIKLGRVTYTPDVSQEKKELCIAKDKATTSGELGYRVTGIVMKNKKGEVQQQAKRKDVYYGIDKDNMEEYFVNFFKGNEVETVNPAMVVDFLEFVKKMIDFFENHSNRFWIGSSLLFIVDNTKNKYRAAWIDIGHAYPLKEGEKDENLLFGLRNIADLLSTILKKVSN